MPAPEPTDRQVRADVYKITRVYLEIERGLRAPDQLEPFLTPTEYRRHRNTPRHPSSRTRDVVVPTDVGHIHLDRHLPGQLTATVPTRETDDRWSALVLHFTRNHTGWRIDQLERLTRPHLARDPYRRPAEPKDLDARIRDVEGERRLVDAAHHAATTQLRELRVAGGTKDRQREVRRQQQTWKRRRAELDHELTNLRTTRGLRVRLADVDRRSQPPATDLADGQLQRLLGPVPDDDWRQGLRDGLVEEITNYRRRWNVTDTRNILGPEPADPDHRRDRDELADTLRAAARALGTSPEPPGDRNTRCRQQQGHVRDVAAER
jgi:hypothetical protein